MSSTLTLKERAMRALLVKPNESRVVAYNLGLFVFLGIGLALGRGTADALFFKRYGIENLPIVYVLSAVSLVVVCTIYAAFADRLSSERFFKYILGILSVLLLVVWGLMQFPGNDWSYPLYYVVYELASELILIHAGLYLNQNLDALQAKRLVPLIFGGSQVGVIIGGIILAVLSPIIGVSNIILIWMLVSIISIAMVWFWHRKQGISPFYRSGRKRKLTVMDSLGDAFQGLRFMKHSALLRMASFALFFMVVLFYVLIYSVNQVYTETFTTEESLSSFFGILVAVNSAIALVLQFFVANRLLRKFGVKTVNLFFPFSSIFSYLVLMVSFTLPSALIGSFNKDVVMTAFRNPVWNLMMNALPGNIQGRARAMTVAVVIPLALSSAGLILMAVKDLDSPVYIALVGFLSAALYLYFSWHMNRVYVKEIVSNLKQKLKLPDDEAGVALRGADESVLQELKQGIQHPDDQIYLAYARSLIDSFPEQATEIIINRLPSADSKVKDQITRLLLPLRSNLLPEMLWQQLENADERFQSTCYYGLIVLNNDAVRNKIPELLVDSHARFRTLGIMGVYSLGMEELQVTAQKVWGELLASDDSLSNMLGLELLDMSELADILPDLNKVDLQHAVKKLMQETEVRGCLVSLQVSPHLASKNVPWLEEQLEQLAQHDNRKVRMATLRGCLSLDNSFAIKILEQGLEDAHPDVRTLAAELFNQFSMQTAEAKYNRLMAASHGSPRSQSAVMKLLLADNAPVKLLSDLALAKVDEAEQLNDAMLLVKHEAEKSDRPALSVLSMVLEERLEGTIDLALQALQGSEDADSISAIRMGMQSHEIQYRATACEALQGLDNKKIGRSLSLIIESHGHKKSGKFKGVTQVVEWCLQRNDPWLSQCAQAVEPLGSI